MAPFGVSAALTPVESTWPAPGFCDRRESGAPGAEPRDALGTTASWAASPQSPGTVLGTLGGVRGEPLYHPVWRGGWDGDRPEQEAPVQDSELGCVEVDAASESKAVGLALVRL